MTAEFVGMSVRTLQRRLAQAGTSHHMLVARARFATAAAVLERTDAKILELALDLGYSDHANFTRAFRHWAGCAPREYRSRQARRQRVAPSPPGDRGGGQAASAPVSDRPVSSRSRTHAAHNVKDTARSKVA
jgi:AraC-like DNA-binding protein